MTWKKGETGNPGGRPVLPPEIKKLRTLTNQQIAEVGALIVEGDRENLLKVKDNPNSSILQIWIASVAATGIKEGNANSLNALLDRLAGKVKEEIDINVYPKSLIIERRDGSEVIIGTELDLLDRKGK